MATKNTNLPRYNNKAAVMEFCGWMVQKALSFDNFVVGSRGWLYILETAGIITKGEFGKAEKLIGNCRKGGELPMWVVAQDEARKITGQEDLDPDDPDLQVQGIIREIHGWVDWYTPFSFWDDMPIFIAMVVEKLDLKSLFEPICKKYHVPLANAKGWSDINLRYNLMRLFKKHEEEGRQCILLYCGDHDPAGLVISDTLRKNFEDLERAADWNPDNLVIDRFGLNYDFIEEQGLTWIDNLETSSGKCLDDPDHKDHKRPYVQDYLLEYGVRKVEANALVTRPEAGRQLCEDTILRHIHEAIGEAEVLEEYEEMLEEPRQELKEKLQVALRDLDLLSPPGTTTK